jgi:hypothetical protein
VGDYDPNTLTGTDDSAAFQAAIDYCVVNLKALFIPEGQYRVDTKIVVPATGSSVRAFRIIGNAVGNSAEQAAAGNQTFSRPAIYYTGTDALFEMDMSSFFFNGFSCEGVNFFQPRASANERTASCFKVLKGTQVNYPRNFRVVDCNFSFWNAVYHPVYSGTSATDPGAYIGAHSWTRVHVRVCNSFALMDRTAHNRFYVTDSYLHSFRNSTFKFLNNAWAYLYLTNTTIEGSDPAVVDASDTELIYKIFLNGVACEYCGNEPADGGWGFLKPKIAPGVRVRAEIHISNNGYGFFDMPQEFRVGPGAIVDSAHQATRVSGFGWGTTTPDRIIPVVSDDVTYGQSEKYTMGWTINQLMPQGGDVTRLGAADFSWLYTSNPDGPTPTKENLPSPLKEMAVANTGQIFSRHDQSGLVAPANGYFYLTGAYKGVGLQRLDATTANRTVTIDRSGTPDAIPLDSNTFWQAGAGSPVSFALVFRGNAGDIIDEAIIFLRAGEFDWVSPVAFKHGNNVLLSAVAGAEIAQAENTATIADSATMDIRGPILRGVYFAKVEVFVSDRSYAAYYVSGNVARSAAPSRDVSQIVKVEKSGIAISTVAGGNNGAAINVQIANTSGVSVTARVVTTLLD